MRVAVISDVHGNLPALQAVLADVDRAGADVVWCLGDLVGYGAHPNECCRIVRDRAVIALAGNHDLGVLGVLDLEDFSHDANAAARWTRRQLDPESRAFLESLEPLDAAPGVQLFHASARDPIWEYVLTFEAAAATFVSSSAPLVLVGHSHVALALRFDGVDVTGDGAAAGLEVELEGARWLLNPGSVGQPRDGDTRAAWLLLDLDRRRASFHRVPYPIAEAQAAIRAAGLPAALADRLAAGT